MGIIDRLSNLFSSRRSAPGTVPALVEGGATFQWPYMGYNPTAEACIRKVVATLSPLDIDLYMHRKGGGRALAFDHPLGIALKHPNAHETPIQFYAAIISDLMRGNAYVRLVRAGAILVLERLDAKDVRVSVDQGRKLFSYGGQTLTESEVLHIPYPFYQRRINSSYDLYLGVGPHEQFAELIELDNQLTAYIKMYFGNSPGKRLMLEVGDKYAGKSASDHYNALMPLIQKYVLGAENAGRIMIPPPDTKLSQLDGTLNLYDDIKSLKELVEREIALAFGVQYSLLSEQNKYDSLDSNQIQFLSDTIRPLGTHIEQSFNRLLKPSETALYCEYDYSAMLKSDPSETASYLAKLVGSGLYTPNEARDVLGMDAVAGGDVPLMPANLWPYTPDNQAAFFAKAKVALSHNPAGDEKQ